MSFITTLLGYPLGWIMWLCYKIVPIYAIALILFTVLTKLALFPLSIKQQKSMVKMQIFQPRMAEIQKKYANNKEKLNEEMMKLYSEEGYNPMSGCLPMLIQMPILFGLIDVIYKPLTHILRMPTEIIEKATEIATRVTEAAGITMNMYSPQLGIVSAVRTDPAAFDALSGFVESITKLNLSFGPIDLTQQPTFAFNWLLLIPILSFITSIGLTMFTMKQTSAAQGDNAAANGMNKGMMLMMPLMSGYFAFMVPAGVGIYWIISNVLMAAQTFLLNKYMNPKDLAAKAREESEARREADRILKIEAKKKAREAGEDPDRAYSQKEINRQKLAAARKRDAEKYGEVYVEVTDEDLK